MQALKVRTFGHVEGGPRKILRAEGAALLLGSMVLYGMVGFSWWLFAALFLTPDLSFLAYLTGKRSGAIAYNAAHSTIGPIVIGCLGVVMSVPVLQISALIWTSHIGFDRLLGYGLKYSSGFTDTHLGIIGRPKG